MRKFKGLLNCKKTETVPQSKNKMDQLVYWNTSGGKGFQSGVRLKGAQEFSLLIWISCRLISINWSHLSDISSVHLSFLFRTPGLHSRLIPILHLLF